VQRLGRQVENLKDKEIAMEALLLSLFLIYPVVLLRRFNRLPARVTGNGSTGRNKPYYERTFVPDDRC